MSIAADAARRTRQSGVVLPFALFILVGVTLLTLGLIRANLLSLRIGGSSVMATETQVAAEMVMSNFYVRNPENDATAMGRFQRNNSQSRCGTVAEIAADSSLYFDCRTPDSSLPNNTNADTISPQRIGCGPPVRSRQPYQATTVMNYVLVQTRVTNSVFGSEGQVGTGRAALVPSCPAD